MIGERIKTLQATFTPHEVVAILTVLQDEHIQTLCKQRFAEDICDTLREFQILLVNA